MKPHPTSHYDHARNDWVCDACGEVTDFCTCEAFPCPNLNDDGHGPDCPICKGEGECFPED